MRVGEEEGEGEEEDQAGEYGGGTSASTITDLFLFSRRTRERQKKEESRALGLRFGSLPVAVESTQSVAVSCLVRQVDANARKKERELERKRRLRVLSSFVLSPSVKRLMLLSLASRLRVAHPWSLQSFRFSDFFLVLFRFFFWSRRSSELPPGMQQEITDQVWKTS